MKKKSVQLIFCAIVLIMILGIVSLYIYDIVSNKTPVTENLFKTLAITFLLLGTLIRIFNGVGRKNLDFYEKSYSNELGCAFQNKQFLRKKLLCAARLYDESNYRKSLKYLGQLLNEAESERDVIPVLLFTALCYTDVGLNDHAEKVYYKLLEYDPNNSQVHSNLGAVFASDGDFDTALKHYNKSMECDSANYYPYINRANCYFRMHDFEKAINDAKKALSLKNNGIEAASLLTVLYALQGDEENKEKYYHISITSGRAPEELNQEIEYFLNEKTQNASLDA